MASITISAPRVVELPDTDEWHLGSTSQRYSTLVVSALNAERFGVSYPQSASSSTYVREVSTIGHYVPDGHALELHDHFGERAELLENAMQNLAVEIVKAHPADVGPLAEQQANLAARAAACRVIVEHLREYC